MQEIKHTTRYVGCVNQIRNGLGETIGIGALLRRQPDYPPVE